MAITYKVNFFTLGSGNCPQYFDADIFSKVVWYYKRLAQSGETPIIESIFEKIIAYMEQTTYKEVLPKVKSALDGRGAEEDAKVMAEQTVVKAMDILLNGVEAEILEMIEYLGYAYRSFSMGDTGLPEFIVTPQINVIEELYSFD